MNPSTIVYGMKWNWTVSFAMWSTTRSALVWQRIHAPSLGRAHGWGWQAKAPAPRYLPQNSCRLAKDTQLVNCSRVDGGADRGAQGPGDKNGEGFAAAGGDDENVVGPEADIFRLSGEH